MPTTSSLPKEILRLLLFLPLAVAACGGDATGPSGGDWQLEFRATWYGDEKTPPASCLMTAVLNTSKAPEPGWSATVDMDVARTAGDATVSAEGSQAVPLTFKLKEVDSDLTDGLVEIVVSGTYSETIPGRETNEGYYRGAWFCDEDFFFADHPDIQAAGWPPLKSILGYWELRPVATP